MKRLRVKNKNGDWGWFVAPDDRWPWKADRKAAARVAALLRARASEGTPVYPDELREMADRLESEAPND